MRRLLGDRDDAWIERWIAEAGCARVRNQLFAEVVARFDASRAGGVDELLSADVRHRERVLHWALEVRDGVCEVWEDDGEAAETSRLHAELSFADALRLATGILHPLRAVALRRVRLDGDVRAAIRVRQCFPAPWEEHSATRRRITPSR